MLSYRHERDTLSEPRVYLSKSRGLEEKLVEGQSPHRLVGGNLQVEFDRDGRLMALRQSGGAFIFLEHKIMGASPWRLVVRDRLRQPRTLTALDARACHIESNSHGLDLTWTEIESAPGLIVQAAITPEEGHLLWRLAVDGLAADAALWRVDFPVLAGLLPIASGDDEQLLLPRAGGYVVRNPSQAIFANSEIGHRISLAYPGSMTMQFIAYYCQRSDGLMVMTQDPDGYYKRFTAERGEGPAGWTLAIEHFPAGMPQSSGRFAPPYPIALSAFRGDWTEAATRYRSWAIRQPWCSRGPLATRGDIPRWLLETGLWVWNRGRSDQVLPGIRRLGQLVQAPIALDWYWWHKTPYDTHFPDYLPPREGEASFRQAIARLHEEGVRAIVYVNGRLWGTSAQSWIAQQAGLAACKQEDGNIYREVYNVFNQAEMAPMCPTTTLWQTTLRNLVDELINRYGLDGVYIDQIGIAAPQLCFDPQHPHPPGGGNHWHRGYRQLIEAARHTTRLHPEAMFPTEGSCEAYLDLFDAFLVLDNSFERMGFYERIGLKWEPVPLFAAVYHDYALHFGSYASLAPPPYDELWPQSQGPLRSSRFDERDFTGAFYAELGRAFVAGAQPMVANVHPQQVDDPALQPCWRFLRDLVHTRLQAAPFLLYGRWLQPLALDAPEITVDFLVRGIYTSPDKERVVQRRLPAVLASLWAAPDGRQALALANISDCSQRVTWKAAGMSGKMVYGINGRGRIPLGRIGNSGVVYNEKIPAHTVQVIEIV